MAGFCYEELNLKLSQNILVLQIYICCWCKANNHETDIVKNKYTNLLCNGIACNVCRVSEWVSDGVNAVVNVKWETFSTI